MRYILTLLFAVLYFVSYGQDTTHRHIIGARTANFKLDTNDVVYDQDGKALHFYQYQKLINTGKHTISLDGPPGVVGTKKHLRELSPQERNARYDMIRKLMAIKSPYLQENTKLNILPLSAIVSAKELENKVVMLVFWSADCPPCTENFEAINSFLKQVHNPDNLVVLAITADDENVAAAKLKEKPLLYAKLFSNAQAIFNVYQLTGYPSYVITDKDHIIRLAMTGTGPITVNSLNNTLQTVLIQ